jgi:microcystin-dependent protein
MTQPFLGQVQPYGFGFSPRSWALCNGQLLSIAQNTALFSLIGTYYGGNGQTTFALPNLQSRTPMHQGTYVGNNYVIGEEAGEETITLNLAELPAHNHGFLGLASAADSKKPNAGYEFASSSSGTNAYYAPDASPQPINSGTVLPYGNNQAHTNLQPYVAINWCICMAGIYPSRN